MLPKITLLPTAIFLLVFAIFPAAGHAQTPSTAGRIAFAAYRNGQWDLYSIAPNGSSPRQLTNDPFEDTHPAYSPDGTKIAYASRRNNNWDVYLLDLQTGQETQLTRLPHYDAAPTWSPDGLSLAYESFRSGNLDIWRIDAAGQEPPVNLTAGSTAGDFAPAWSPDGRYIAFTSWRAGNKDLYLLEPDSGNITPLTNSPAAEEWPAWRPDGSQLAFVTNNLGDREVFTLSLNRGPARPVTWLGRTDGPVWSPDGQAIAAVFHRWDGEIVAVQNPSGSHQLPGLLTGIITVQGRLTWHSGAVDFGQPVGALVGAGLPGFEEQVTPNTDPAAEPYNLVRLDNLQVGTPWLADTVDDSFRAWRSQMQAEVGYDFLAQLSDALRDVASYSDTSQYASWHKSGRAVDTLFDYHVDGQLVHEIVREDYSGETYWRIMLRCVDQSGRCGRPITDNPWNYSSRARTEIAPEQGGIEKAIPTGYYVDMTALARRYGWQRISSYDDEEYSWTWHFLAFEYWHYQKRLHTGPYNSEVSQAANWYQAMQEVYPQATLDRYFTWQKMRDLDEDPHLIALKGVPLPLEMKPWWRLVLGGR